jgi:hypothetical protein
MDRKTRRTSARYKVNDCHKFDKNGTEICITFQNGIAVDVQYFRTGLFSTAEINELLDKNAEGSVLGLHPDVSSRCGT